MKSTTEMRHPHAAPRPASALRGAPATAPGLNTPRPSLTEQPAWPSPCRVVVADACGFGRRGLVRLLQMQIPASGAVRGLSSLEGLPWRPRLWCATDCLVVRLRPTLGELLADLVTLARMLLVPRPRPVRTVVLTALSPACVRRMLHALRCPVGGVVVIPARSRALALLDGVFGREAPAVPAGLAAGEEGLSQLSRGEMLSLRDALLGVPGHLQAVRRGVSVKTTHSQRLNALRRMNVVNMKTLLVSALMEPGRHG